VKEDVMELIHDIMHKYRSQQYRALRDSEHDITHMDSRVLGYFHRHPGATQSDLVAHSGRDKAQLARLIKNLRDRGLLAATVDPADRRNVRLTLTPSGVALQAGLRQSARHVATRAVAGLDSAEQHQLRDLLLRVQTNLDAPD
jgi:DNA-binding MarR family transcriptional regulator